MKSCAPGRLLSCDAFASHDKSSEIWRFLKTSLGYTAEYPHYKSKTLKFKTNLFRPTAISGAAVVFACFSLLNTGAQAESWTGAADNNFTNSANRVGGIVPTGWQATTFGSNSVNGTVNLDGWVPLGTVTLTSGLNQAITMSGPSTLNLGGGAIVMSASNYNLTVNGRITRALWGGGYNVQGYSDIVKDGAGTAVVTTATSYIGNIIVNGGTLQTSEATPFSPPPVRPPALSTAFTPKSNF
jgi:autotransporter-associated beta strand protein